MCFQPLDSSVPGPGLWSGGSSERVALSSLGSDRSTGVPIVPKTSPGCTTTHNGPDSLSSWDAGRPLVHWSGRVVTPCRGLTASVRTKSCSLAGGTGEPGSVFNSFHLFPFPFTKQWIGSSASSDGSQLILPPPSLPAFSFTLFSARSWCSVLASVYLW